MNGLVAVACDMCSVEDLKQTLKDPAHKVKILERSFPPWALFLNNVEYYPKGKNIIISKHGKVEIAR